MGVNDVMTVPLKDVYQLLIGECRYGYRRNNHLMPDGAYDKVKRLLPKMYEVDKEYAVHTMKQLCEECISDQLIMNFYDGEDDEFGNRAEAIKFIKYALDWIHEHEDLKEGEKEWFPYNYDLFLDNVAKDDEPRYNVYEINGDEKIKLTEDPVSKKKYLEVIFGTAESGVCRTETHKLSEEYNDLRRSYTYHVLEPFVKDFYVEHI